MFLSFFEVLLKSKAIEVFLFNFLVGGLGFACLGCFFFSCFGVVSWGFGSDLLVLICWF